MATSSGVSGKHCRDITLAVLGTMLVCELVTSLGFYRYIEKESVVIEEQRIALKKASEEKVRLLGSLNKANTSVSQLLGDLSSLNTKVAGAKATIDSYRAPGLSASAAKAAQEKAALDKGREQQIEQLLMEIEDLKSQKEALKKKEAGAVQAPSGGGGGGGGGGVEMRWLTIGIPTVPRPGDLDYLSQTINAFKRQLPVDKTDPFYGKVVIVVLNNKPGAHKVFSQEKAQTEGSEHAIYFKFVEASVQQIDSSANREGDPNVPGAKVRIQTRAVISLMRHSVGLSSHFLFMEDDFLPCPHSLRSLHYLIAKSHAYFPGGWSGIRVSYGLCGIVLNGRDVEQVADYLEQHQSRRPPDHLLPEWIAAETQQAQVYLQGRRNIGYRFNIFEHIGSTSTLRAAKQVGWPGCYEELVYPTVFEGEAWKPSKCAGDDMWPCERPATWPKHWTLWHAQHKGPGPDVKWMGPRDK